MSCGVITALIVSCDEAKEGGTRGGEGTYHPFVVKWVEPVSWLTDRAMLFLWRLQTESTAIPSLETLDPSKPQSHNNHT